jgi:hypothetical protein
VAVAARVTFGVTPPCVGSVRASDRPTGAAVLARCDFGHSKDPLRWALKPLFVCSRGFIPAVKLYCAVRCARRTSGSCPLLRASEMPAQPFVSRLSQVSNLHPSRSRTRSVIG